MAIKRADRVRKSLIREVSDLIRTQIKDPRISGIVSVTDIELSNDCRYAKIFISVFGSEEEQEKTMTALESSTGYIRNELGKRIKMRFTPEIKFKIDDSLERGTKVLQILDRISQGDD